MRGALPAVLAGVAYGAHRARNARQRAGGAARGGKSSVPPRAAMRAGENDPAAAAITAASIPPMSGGEFYSPPAVSGSKASAIAWSEALSATGKQLSDEGFEDQAVMCFVAAGELDAIGHDSYEPR